MLPNRGHGWGFLADVELIYGGRKCSVEKYQNIK